MPHRDRVLKESGERRKGNLSENFVVVLNGQNLFQENIFFKMMALSGIPEINPNFVILNGMTPFSIFLLDYQDNSMVRLLKVPYT